MANSKSLSTCIQHSARYFSFLDNSIRHLNNYQELREWMQEQHPEIYEDWLLYQSREGE